MARFTSLDAVLSGASFSHGHGHDVSAASGRFDLNQRLREARLADLAGMSAGDERRIKGLVKEIECGEGLSSKVDGTEEPPEVKRGEDDVSLFLLSPSPPFFFDCST